jgi:uncharacterized protein YggE
LQIRKEIKEKKMRNKIFSLSVLMLLTLIVSACGTAYAQETSPESIRTINVTGTGEVLLTPDIAYVSIGVRSEGEDAAVAVTENNSKSDEVVQALIDSGVDQNDIQTSNFNIYPQQQYDERGNIQATTYIVENTVRVVVRDLETIGELLNAAVEAGANSIYGVQFDVADDESARSEARQAAVADAQMQAEELAEAAGIGLGRVQSISTYGGQPIPLYEGKGGAGPVMLEAEVPISPGQLMLTVDVNVVYEIR